jgi:GTPase
MSQFIDQVRIKIRSGDGGNGAVAWRREKYEPMGGPAGGDGGRGGSVFIQATRDMSTLIDFRYKTSYEAEPGTRGGSKNKYGRSGEDLYIKVPVGTVVRDLTADQIVADLTEDGQTAMVAEGGHGGRGNTKMASPTRRAPHHCEPGQPGIERDLELELKLLADVVLVGLPNAGKSSLLSVMTAARPKIADYPFSTLEPQLGVVRKPDGDGYVIADIPGLIEGASQGAGLGHKFLRHIERTRLIVHLVDLTSENLLEDIATIQQELALYSERLEKLPRILALNKLDLLDESQTNDQLELVKSNQDRLWRDEQSAPLATLAISCATREGLDVLQNTLLEQLSRLQSSAHLHELEPDVRAYEHPGEEYHIVRQRKQFIVVGDRIDRLVAVTDMKSPESLHHLYRVLRAMGVVEQLVQQGANAGSEIVLGGTVFSFGEDMM